MKDEPYQCRLGKLLANFHSLEFSLRAFLQNLPDAPPFGLPYGTDVYTLKVGSEIAVNDFTSYDSLGVLIGKYNAKVKAKGGIPLDTSLVDLRDALAHGRVSARDEHRNLHLLKFSPAKNGNVRVTYNEEMTDEWFSSNIARVNNALHTVVKHIEPQQGVPADRSRPAGEPGG